MKLAIPLLLCLGSGLVGGVFFAFSTFVMRAPAQLPADQGARAMQRINVVVLNPAFLGVFIGTAVVAVIGAIVGLLDWGGTRSALLVAAGLAYLIGSFGVTVRFNVPRNQRLATHDADTEAAARYWQTYLREWTHWNHVRTAASMLAAGGAALALLY